MPALISLAVANLLRRNLRRTLLMTIAVACATVVFCAVTVIPYISEKIVHIADQSPRLVVVNRTAMRFGLPEAYYDKIVKLPDVVAVNRMVWYAGVYDDPHHQFPTIALDPDNPDVLWPEYGLDRRTVAAFRKVRSGAIVGDTTMHRFGWHLGQHVTLRSQLYPVTLTFTIVGTYDHGPDLSVFMMRRDYLEEALHNDAHVDMMWVRCSTTSATGTVASEIDGMFHNSAAETRTDSEKAFLITYLVRFQSVINLVELIGLVAVFSIALAVLNGTAMTLRERRKELSILRTLGFSREQIACALAIEAGVIALAGGIVGTIVAATSLTVARGSVAALGEVLAFGMPLQIVAGGIAIAMALGVVAALIPAVGVLRGPVHESIRAEA